MTKSIAADLDKLSTSELKTLKTAQIGGDVDQKVLKPILNKLSTETLKSMQSEVYANQTDRKSVV